jgi:hypothetical protein
MPIMLQCQQGPQRSNQKVLKHGAPTNAIAVATLIPHALCCSGGVVSDAKQPDDHRASRASHLVVWYVAVPGTVPPHNTYGDGRAVGSLQQRSSGGTCKVNPLGL